MKKETHKFSLSLAAEGYYYVEIKEDVEFEIEDLQQLVELEKEISGKKMPVLVICAPTASTNSDLLKYLARNENNPLSVADAFIVNSLAQKVLAYVYTRYNKPERPVNFFKKKEDGLEWLKQFLNNKA